MTAGVGDVLVVYDDATMRAFLTAALEDEGYHVVAGAANAAVLGLARAQRPAVIILDLPTREDYPWEWSPTVMEIIWGLRTDPETAPIPLIALSDGAATRVSPLLPIQRHLSTPVDLADLSRAVGQWTARPADRPGVLPREPRVTASRCPDDRRPAPLVTPLRWWGWAEVERTARRDAVAGHASRFTNPGPAADAASPESVGGRTSLWRRLTRAERGRDEQQNRDT